MRYGIRDTGYGIRDNKICIQFMFMASFILKINCVVFKEFYTEIPSPSNNRQQSSIAYLVSRITY
jgi:hypothetical protein